MKPFTIVEEVAVAIPIANIDTDMLVPAAFLKTISRRGLADALFHNLRISDPEFPLNRAPWNSAGILIARENFGCGSSREHAPWALLDFGITCVVAPSFAEIFEQNCFKNGILPMVLPTEGVNALMALASRPETARMVVNLVDKTITCGNFRASFEVNAERRDRLLNGLDEVSLSLAHADEIATFERGRENQPWLKPIPHDIATLRV